MPAFTRLLRRRLRFSLVLTFTFALLAAFFFTGSVRRSMHLARLDGSPAQRERALDHLVRTSRVDPALTRAVIHCLDTLPPEAALHTYIAMGRAAEARGVPISPAAPPRLIQNLHRFDVAAFIRAFELLAASGNATDQALIEQAAQRLPSASPDHAQALRQLLTDQGAWSTPPVPATVYLDWVAKRGADTQPALRRHAAGLLACLPESVFESPMHRVKVRSLLSALADDMQPDVRHAALDAAAALHAVDPQTTEISVRLQNDPNPTVRAAAADIVDLLSGQRLSAPTAPRPVLGLDVVTASNRLSLWRSLLLVPDRPTDRRVREQVAQAPVGEEHPHTPLVYAAAYRQAHVNPALLARARTHDLPQAEWRRLLAQLEGAHPGSVMMDLPPATPQALRPAATRAAHQPHPRWLHAVLRLDDQPALRANACVVAVERFDHTTRGALINQLLDAPDPHSRVSGALIAGLCGQRIGDLRQCAELDPDPVVRQFAQLARWMQHDLPDAHARAAERLGHAELPEPLVMLALLHRGQWGPVLDRIFDPDVYNPEQRRVLLGRQRFALVLGQHLPPDAPPLHLWADGDHFARELDVLRAWAAIHRRRGEGVPQNINNYW